MSGVRPFDRADQEVPRARDDPVVAEPRLAPRFVGPFDQCEPGGLCGKASVQRTGSRLKLAQ
jgi:hypothetical protein